MLSRRSHPNDFFMPRRCELTGKKASSGHLRSFSNRATKRKFLPNIISKKILDPGTGKYVTRRIAASTLRTLLKQDQHIVEQAKEILALQGK